MGMDSTEGIVCIMGIEMPWRTLGIIGTLGMVGIDNILDTAYIANIYIDFLCGGYMHKIAILNQKGGVGKTTTVANTGEALSQKGKRVLMVDLDAQANLTQGLGLKPKELSASLYHLLVGQMDNPAEVIIPMADNLHILPSNINLAAADVSLSSTPGGEFALKEVLSHESIKQYDFVLVDCPPSLGKLTVNALAAVDSVIVTIEPEVYALHGVATLFDSIRMVQKRINPDLRILGALITTYDGRQTLHRESLGLVEAAFKDGTFKTAIRKNVDLAGAPAQGTTIFRFRPKSYGAQDYMAFTTELIAKLEA